MTASEDVRSIKKEFGIIGRDVELEKALATVRSGRHLMIEGPVGVGKTILAVAVSRFLGRPVFRVDGDERYTEQKLSGWFDPPIVLEKGYVKDAFIPGPLTSAMREGGVLFMNEMNRMPEGVQNILLPAMDEGIIEVPKVGTIRAKQGFVVMATQNPREFVATTAISEALSDRFELILLDYQSEDEEIQIVHRNFPDAHEELVARAVWIGRRTRDHPNIRRGASVRGAMSITQLSAGLSPDLLEGIRKAAHMALPTRIEMREESRATASEVIDEIVNECFSLPPPSPGAPIRNEKEEERKRRKRDEMPERRVDVADLVKIIEERSPEDIEGSDDIGWAIAQKYPQLRVQLRDVALVELAKRIAIKAIIRRVLQLLGPVSIPTQIVREEFRVGTDSEIDVDTTLENIVDKAHPDVSDIIVERRQPRSAAVALMLDASLSMSGDKLAIATASIAVLAYRLKMVDYLLITFNDRPTVVKRFHEARNLDDLISQLLDFNATGYTNIEWALSKGKEELSRSETRNRVGVLVTDGNFTVGEDPSQAALGYRRLFVIMTESHDCRPDVCEQVARMGGGRMYEISGYDEMPRVLYKVLRMVALGAPPNPH